MRRSVNYAFTLLKSEFEEPLGFGYPDDVDAEQIVEDMGDYESRRDFLRDWLSDDDVEVRIDVIDDESGEVVSSATWAG